MVQMTEKTRLCVRTFLDPSDSGSGAHAVLMEEGADWFTLRISDGSHTVTLDFARTTEALRKVEKLSHMLEMLRPRLREGIG